MTPSIDSNAFSFFLNISNSCALPVPVPVNVTAIQLMHQDVILIF